MPQRTEDLSDADIQVLEAFCKAFCDWYKKIAKEEHLLRVIGRSNCPGCKNKDQDFDFPRPK